MLNLLMFYSNSGYYFSCFPSNRLITKTNSNSTCFEDEEGGDNVVDGNSEEEYQEIEEVEDDNEESKERDE